MQNQIKIIKSLFPESSLEIHSFLIQSKQFPLGHKHWVLLFTHLRPKPQSESKIQNSP